MIDQSWQSLNPEERQVYARLSVFKGGFQRQAAEQVAGASLSILTALVDKSLLRWEPDDRYQIHELLRKFAWDKLNADPEAIKTTSFLHCMYYANFLYQYSASITGPRPLDVCRSITAELQNIRAAWQQAVEDANLPALKKATYTFYEFCDLTGHYLEGAEAFELATARLMENEQGGPEGPHALFRGRILAFDESAAIEWARLMAEGTAHGRPRSALDMVIAATALANQCVLVTLNERHFQGAIELFNPLRSVG